jgi:DNA-binding response OmpR family regulator
MKTVAELVASGVEVVVVDDIESAQKIVSRYLTQLGFRTIHVASSAEQGFRTVANHIQARVVIIDIVMPGESGYDLVRRLESLEDGRPLIIVLTSVGSPDGTACGSYRGLPLIPLKKPFSRHALEERLRKAISIMAP